MSWWKQVALSIVVLAAAAVAWAMFFPGAQQVLARWGMDWAVAATAPDKAERRNGGGANSGGAGQPMVVTAAVTTETINDRLSATRHRAGQELGGGQALQHRPAD